LPVSDNIILKGYCQPPLSQGPFLRSGAITHFVQDLIERFRIDTPSPLTPVRLLSGGNLQRCILAREITAGRGLLVAVHPTRGLDVGATEGVQHTLLEQRAQGVAVLLISEDLDELLAVSDRIAVLYEGQIMGIVAAEGADVAAIGLMMAGTRPAMAKGG
jgi:simple sugar transport system ATP-binding protein